MRIWLAQLTDDVPADKERYVCTGIALQQYVAAFRDAPARTIFPRRSGRGTLKNSEQTKPDLPIIAPRYFVVSYLYERRNIGGQVDGALSVSTTVRVTDHPVAVVRLQCTKTNYSTGASKAGMIPSHRHVTVLLG